MNSNYSTTNSLSIHLANNTPIVVFGAGNLGRKIANFLNTEKKNIIAFSDNNSRIWNQHILGLKVLSPSELPVGVIVIISIWSPENSYIQTKEQLLKTGVSQIFHASGLMKLFPKQLLPHYHFETSDYYLKYQQLHNEVVDVLADEESKKQYLAHLDCRVNLNFEGLPKADTINQYFPADVVKLLDTEVFLDAGAFTGDTLEDFIKRTNGIFSKYVALEPDPVNREKLKQASLRSGFSEKIEICDYAVGAENCMLHFEATGGGGAVISDNGGIEVECIKIDDKFL